MTEIGVQLPEIGVQLRPKPVFNFARNRCSTSSEKPTRAVLELKRVFEAAQEDPAGVTRIATRKPGSEFTASPDSEVLAFAQERAGNALALTGLWTNYGSNLNWHIGGGQGRRSSIIHFQLRPDPLVE